MHKNIKLNELVCAGPGGQCVMQWGCGDDGGESGEQLSCLLPATAAVTTRACKKQ